MTTKLSNVSKPYSTLTSIVNEQLIKTANLMHIQYWITYNTYYVVVLWAICLSHFAKSELNCFPRGINPKVKRQHLILIFMLCFQIFWHPVMNTLSHWFEIFFNLWLTPSWCNKKTRWNGLLISILAMLPKGEITFEKCGFKLPTMVFWAVWNTKSTCCFLSQFLSLLIYDKAVTANHITKKF